MKKKINNNISDSMSSIIGADARLEGRLILDGSVRIDGAFDGMLASEGTVTIGHRGSITGDISADEVIIGGQVSGSIVAKTRVVLEESARVEGDLATNSLTIEEGAVFNGHSSMGAEAVGELQQRLKEARQESRPEKGGITLYDEDGEPLEEETPSAQAS